MKYVWRKGTVSTVRSHALINYHHYYYARNKASGIALASFIYSQIEKEKQP